MIQINGKKRELESISLEEFLTKEGYRMDTIAVEINENVIPKSRYQEVMLKDEDVVEIICFVRGG